MQLLCRHWLRSQRWVALAELHTLPTLWFRNTWSWNRDPQRPSIAAAGPGTLQADHSILGTYQLYCNHARIEGNAGGVPAGASRASAKRTGKLAQDAATPLTATPVPAPAERTLYDILNRLGYCLRRVRKTKPQKNSPRPTPSSTT